MTLPSITFSTVLIKPQVYPRQSNSLYNSVATVVLAKTQGVNKLVIAVNKMDDPTVEWSETRYKECLNKLTMFLKGVGYNPKTDLAFMPTSAQTTVGIKDRVPKELAPWHDGPSLLEYLDGMTSLERKLNAPFMMPIAAKYRDL